MKTRRPLISGLYWLFVIGFIIQITAVGWYFYGVLVPNSKDVLYVHSDVRIFPDSSYTYSIPVVNKDLNIEAKIGQKQFGRSIVFYRNYKDVNSKAWVVLFLNMSQYLIWLLFTWQLLKVFKSLKQSQIFEKGNIWRLRVVAFVVGIAPILELIRNIIYPSLFSENAVLPNHRIAYYYDASMFAGIFYMVIILLVVEIFKFGISLKVEQDLTI
ncbi:MAG: DUF2975 domain-containing protein [Bacteroidia bacterium]|jgi:hypothetical protein|nr:DUF2975 domain-containing protein [Bacteroidia bacterium]